MISENPLKPAVVPRKGLEPPRLAALAPEASTYRYISMVVLTFYAILSYEKLRLTEAKSKVIFSLLKPFLGGQYLDRGEHKLLPTWSRQYAPSM